MGKKSDESKRMLKEEKLKDYQGLFDELAKESDRAAATVGAAFLDEKLRRLLKAYLIDDEQAVNGLVGDDNTYDRPLSTFGSRASACYCLGLVSKEIKADLDTISKIRNKFAHELHGLSFEEESIQGLTGSLKMVRRICTGWRLSNRNWYTTAVCPWQRTWN